MSSNKQPWKQRCARQAYSQQDGAAAGDTDVSSQPSQSAWGFKNTGIKIKEYLEDREYREAQKEAARRLKTMRFWIRHEVPLKEEDFVRVPALFWESGGEGGEAKYYTMLPSAINGVVSGRSYLMPDAEGPVIKGGGGEDQFQKAINQVLAEAGMTTLIPYEARGPWQAYGGIHCATNAWRKVSRDWWKEVASS